MLFSCINITFLKKGFQEIKKVFMNTVMIGQTRNDKYILRTDTSKISVVAVLSQLNDKGTEGVMTMKSRCLMGY